MTVRRTGGFAGVDQVLVVRPDGRWRWTPGRHGGGPRSGRLAPATRRALARLAGRIRSSGPVPGQRSAGPRCADGFHYSVRVGTASAAWYDCDGDPPRPAVDLLALLSGSTPL